MSHREPTHCSLLPSHGLFSPVDAFDICDLFYVLAGDGIHIYNEIGGLLYSLGSEVAFCRDIPKVKNFFEIFRIFSGFTNPYPDFRDFSILPKIKNSDPEGIRDLEKSHPEANSGLVS